MSAFDARNGQLITTDQLKGFALTLVLSPPLLAGMLWVFDWAGKLFVPYIMAFS